MSVSTSTNRSGAWHWVWNWNIRHHELTAKHTSHHECQDWWVGRLLWKETGTVCKPEGSWKLSPARTGQKAMPPSEQVPGWWTPSTGSFLSFLIPCAYSLTSDMQDGLPPSPHRSARGPPQSEGLPTAVENGGGKPQISGSCSKSYSLLDHPTAGRMWDSSPCRTEALRKATGWRSRHGNNPFNLRAMEKSTETLAILDPAVLLPNPGQIPRSL